MEGEIAETTPQSPSVTAPLTSGADGVATYWVSCSSNIIRLVVYCFLNIDIMINSNFLLLFRI